jgi:FkbM family methyltransferase
MRASVVQAGRQFIKALARVFGVDVVRQKNSPRLTLLGLRDRPIRTIIDVGANTGQFAREMRRMFPNSKIYSFEPLTGPFAHLDVWAKEQGGHVQTFNVALGDSSGEAKMNCHIEHTPSSSFLASTELILEQYPFTQAQQSVSVRLARLDDVLAGLDEPLEREVLVKLDVQGYEDRVLRGASATLSVVSACIVEVNIDTLYQGQADFLTLVAQLHDAGLSYAGNLSQSYAEDGHVAWFDAVFKRS